MNGVAWNGVNTVQKCKHANEINYNYQSSIY